ncbi:putative F-box/kelch-repeat protein At4g22430 [Lactuca sativa]|uniref:putative F-box/kelch-repeat protein At4g22430 n=1 Tax=Lactuca sativa TaxID=4236 RepID=UPI000CC75E5A|nr:putative F-box/kelch-repeat protein At4g22430 [Lactuca sativa]
MEDDDTSHSSNQFKVDGDHNTVIQQFLPNNISIKREQLFWYDIRSFPDSLLVEILARLPLKSIFRFKRVYKHWHTLISHPSFCRFYFSILNSNAASFRILYRYIYLSNFKELLNRFRPEIHTCSEFSLLFLSSIEEHEGQRPYQFKVLAMSNGLILCCLWSSSPFVYYVCDPVTRQWIVLPTSTSQSQFFFGEGLITRVNQDHILTDYTVVRVNFPESQSNHLNLEMFSSETGKWVSYELHCPTPIKLRNIHGGAPIHCYEAFHWLTHNHGMVAFDPYKDPKSVRLIPLPRDRDLESEHNYDGLYRLFDEWHGTLRYFEVADDPTKLYFLTMWSMKDYEKGEWCCEFMVMRRDLELSNWLLKGKFLPISFHPLNLNVVYLRCIEIGCIVSYDVVNRRLDVVCKLNGGLEDEEVFSWRVVIPFLLPRWPQPLPATPRSATPPPPPPLRPW